MSTHEKKEIENCYFLRNLSFVTTGITQL